MRNDAEHPLSPVLFFPHGGGPLPLLGGPEQQGLLDFLRGITPTLGEPAAILVISAHWEEDQATITAGAHPGLIYDYYGFPDAAYEIEYPAPGSPQLAETILNLLQAADIDARLDENRGFDHGLFVPLKIMFPEAGIPCVQLSLIKTLDPETHIKMGAALTALREQNVLILGSGFSFHNLPAFFEKDDLGIDLRNEAFEAWLIETCCDANLSINERETRLLDWQKAPGARYCHPGEEHLMPLHVCFGFAKTPARLVFEDQIARKKTSAYLW
jgi:4,5-DOPA dioxygenase extradiol